MANSSKRSLTRARSDNLDFPLPVSLRGQFARLTVRERETIARSGVFLADVGLWGITTCRGIADQSGMALSTEPGRPWLPTERSLSLAHSVLLVSWYLIHASPAVARVLLGMNAAGVAAYRELGVHDLAYIARTHPDRVRPRWPNQLEVWTVICGGCERRGEHGSSIDDAAVSAGERRKFRGVVRTRSLGMKRRLGNATRRSTVSATAPGGRPATPPP